MNMSVFANNVGYLFYGGTAILGGMLYGSYKFGRNVVWK